MVDYVKDIGGGAQMMIRDRGLEDKHVEFWFRASAGTFNNQQTWAYNVGEGFVQADFKLRSGGAWDVLAGKWITTSRNVTMRIMGEGLGWPTTDHTVWINRSTPPPPPIMHWATAYSTHQVHVHFVGNGDGGLPVHEWQIGYGKDPWFPQQFVWGFGNDHISGLDPDWWYFWARGRNDMGWGQWSNKAMAHPWRTPDPPTPVNLLEFTQNSVRAQFAGGFDGGTPHLEYQVAYGLDPNTPQVHVQANSGDTYLSNLDPGKTYYFWARGRNAVGWSPYSPIRVGTLRAGAMVKHSGVWKRALPYVKVNGVWRLAKPYVKSSGVWKETS